MKLAADEIRALTAEVAMSRCPHCTRSRLSWVRTGTGLAVHCGSCTYRGPIEPDFYPEFAPGTFHPWLVTADLHLVGVA